MIDKLKRLMFLATIAAGAFAVIEQLSRPPSERTWHGLVFGFVPYDFRRPTIERLKRSWWAPDDPHLLTPRAFGVGWDLNLARLYQLAMQPARTDGDG